MELELVADGLSFLIAIGGGIVKQVGRGVGLEGVIEAREAGFVIHLEHQLLEDSQIGIGEVAFVIEVGALLLAPLRQPGHMEDVGVLHVDEHPPE